MQALRAVLALLLPLFGGLSAFAQESKPASPTTSLQLGGTLTLSVQRGTIAADLLVRHVPLLADGRIWLHTGLNVESFRDSTGQQVFEYTRRFAPDTTQEAWQYQRVDERGRPLPWPRTLRVRYTGGYPVQADSSQSPRRDDYKGRLAFNGQTVRGTEQTAWYPVLYDRSHDQRLNAYTYDIEVTCADCQTLYLTGSDPMPGPQQRFVSRVPVPLVLFAGNYATQRLGADWLLNSRLTPGQAATFEGFVAGIRTYYEHQLGIPYRQALTFLHATPVSKRNGWLFVTFPTVASVGWQQDFSSLFHGETLADSTLLPVLCHEFGHYYFGALVQPTAELRWFFLEGVTEYVGLKAVQHRLSAQLYRKKLADYHRTLSATGELPALSAVKQAAEISGTYRYVIAPLQLLALERQIGEKQLWRWLRTVVQAPTPHTDYAFLLRSLRQSGLSEAAVTSWVTRYTSGGPAMKQALLEVATPSWQGPQTRKKLFTGGH
jgi:hypothetical protein